MTIELKRYYGDYNVTKSYITFTDDNGRRLFVCEARELQYVDWQNGEQIRGSSFFCMPTGTYNLKVTTDIGNPLCYRVIGATSHRSTKICVDTRSRDDRRHDRILLGFSDGNKDLSLRNLCDKEKCRDLLYRTILQQAQQCEEAILVVSNDALKTHSPHKGVSLP